MQGHQAGRPVRAQNLIATLLVALAVVLGGGGSPAPLPELALQLSSLMALVAWAFLAQAPLPTAARQAWTIAAILVALPLVQLIPLPPFLWHALPARQTEVMALDLVGAADSWRPWSVAPARTLASLLAVMVPAIVLLMTASLGRAGRGMIMAALAGTGMLALLIGVAQMTGGSAQSFRFYVPDVGYLNGFQANHNSAADVLLIAMIAFAAAVREWADRRGLPHHAGYRLGLIGGATVLFSLGVFLTASRAGALLLPVAWAAVLFIVWPWLRFSRRTWTVIALAGLASVVAAAIFLQSNGVIVRITGRFEFAGEFRPQLWKDARYAIAQYFPLGAGVGTFAPVFIAIERLEVVDPSVPNRAHNELLEVMMEAGVPGVLALMAISLILTRLLLAGWRRAPAGSPAQVLLAGGTFSVIALHSLVDYPLRSMSLACIAAAAAGLLMPAPGTAAQAGAAPERN